MHIHRLEFVAAQHFDQLACLQLFLAHRVRCESDAQSRHQASEKRRRRIRLQPAMDVDRRHRAVAGEAPALARARPGTEDTIMRRKIGRRFGRAACFQISRRRDDPALHGG